MQFTLVILIVLIPSIISLKCYVCNSNENKNCADSSNLEDFIKICNETDESYCRKIDQIVEKQSSIVRTCGSKIGTKSCYKTTGVNHANVCSCNEDLCNNAMSLNRQKIISLIAILAIIMIVLR